MSLVSKLAVAAVLASSFPALAAARDCDHGVDRRPPAAPWAPPAAHPAPYRPPRHVPDRWTEAGWRERELAHLRTEFRDLDRRREAFYARHRGPGQVRRFERWYAARRAELERRWNDLQYVAWR